MKFIFKLMDEADASAIQGWSYEEPYSVYNWEAEDDISEMLDRRSPHYAVQDERGELIGFFSYGSSAEPWNNHEPFLYNESKTITVGLGMRPDLTGKGLGLAFVNTGLDFAREQFKPDHFRLFVMKFNDRAILVYERAGFQRVGVYVQHKPNGDREFLEMRTEIRG